MNNVVTLFSCCFCIKEILETEFTLKGIRGIWEKIRIDCTSWRSIILKLKRLSPRVTLSPTWLSRITFPIFSLSSLCEGHLPLGEIRGRDKNIWPAQNPCPSPKHRGNSERLQTFRGTARLMLNYVAITKPGRCPTFPVFTTVWRYSPR